MTAKRKAKPDKPSISPKQGLWPADRVERRPIGELLAYPQNPMQHSDAQVAQIAASMREFGWTMPALVDENGVLICGHGRIRAAQLLGLAEVPVMTARGWTEDQKRAYRIADNSIPRNSQWDETMLRLELTDLKLADYPLELLGFDDVQLVSFMAGVSASGDPEATPEPPIVPVSRTGDLWLLGKHRLLCGDATSKKDVERLLGKSKPLLMVTDSPYGVDYDPDWRNRANRAHGVRAVGKVQNDDQVDWRKAWAIFPGDVAYSWHAGRHARTVQESLESQGFEIVSQIIWAKSRLIISRGDYHWQHEPCWYAVRKGKPHHWNGDRSQTTLWSINHQKSETGHSAQKPIECMKRPIENNSRTGEPVYDPFVGSGTTIIAAEMTGRHCLAIEIAPEYVDVAVQRWQTYAKKPATLEATGQTFDEVAAERSAEALAAE